MGLTIFFIASVASARLIFSRNVKWYLPLLFFAAPFGISAETPFGISLSAVWMAEILFWSSLILIGNLRPRRLVTFEKLFLLFLIWCFANTIRNHDIGIGFRVLLKFSFPVCILLLGHSISMSALEYRQVFRKLAIAAGLVLLLHVSYKGMFGAHDRSYHWTVFAIPAVFSDYSAIVASFLLVCWWLCHKFRYIVLFSLAALSPIVFAVRTGILAVAAGATVYVMTVYRVRALPFVAVAYLATCLAIFAIPGIRDHMFVNPGQVDVSSAIVRPQQIDFDNINSSGRFYIWEDALRRFWLPYPMVGSGTGVSQTVLYATAPDKAKVVHSGYVRILCDVGLIGLSLFAAAVVSCSYHAVRIFRISRSRVTRALALAAVSTLGACLICMAFDNVFDYGDQTLLFPFAFLGMMLASFERESIEIGIDEDRKFCDRHRFIHQSARRFRHKIRG